MLMQRRTLLAALGVVAVLASAYSAHALQTEVIATEFTGFDTSVRIFLDDAGGDIAVTLTVNEGLADLRGFFLNIDSSALDGVEVTGDDVNGFEYDEDGVTNLKHGVNLNGGGSPCPCDLGVAIGTPGIGKDDIFTTTFVLHVDGSSLVLDDLAGGLIGVRVTSVGSGGSVDGLAALSDSLDDNIERPGSSKLVAVIPDPIIPIPEPSTAVLIALGLASLRYRSRR